jgi:FlaA1/EpsC-like NDP-sugar epimerase
MYEELLLGDNPQPTDHSRIMRALEAKLSWTELSEMLDELRDALDRGEVDHAMAVVQRAVPDYAGKDRSAITTSSGPLRDVGMGINAG